VIRRELDDDLILHDEGLLAAVERRAARRYGQAKRGGQRRPCYSRSESLLRRAGPADQRRHSEEFGAFIASEATRWTTLAKAVGVKME
jgi:hypothetical protein